MISLIELTELYIKAFNNKELGVVATLFHDNASLTDPSVSVFGRKEVISIIKSIFDSHKKLEFKAKNIFIKDSTSIIEFELILDNHIFIGVDIINWNHDRITNLRAYLYKIS